MKQKYQSDLDLYYCRILLVLAAILAMKYDACFGQIPTWRQGYLFRFTIALFAWPLLAICMILVSHNTIDAVNGDRDSSY